MHEPQLSIAALPEPPTLLGVRLRPYSLGHEIHLHRRNSPFLMSSWGELRELPKPRRMAVTMQAVTVCSRLFHENMKPMGRWKLWHSLCGFCNLDAAVVSLWTHIKLGHDSFRSELPSGEGMKSRAIGAPQVLRLYQFVLDNIPEREIAIYSGRRVTAWDYPMSLATMLMQTRNESDDLLKIYNWQDKAHDDYVKKMEESGEARKVAETLGFKFK